MRKYVGIIKKTFIFIALSCIIMLTVTSCAKKRFLVIDEPDSKGTGTEKISETSEIGETGDSSDKTEDTEINIPARVYYIGEYTLGSGPNLLNINVEAANTSYTSVDGVLYDITGGTLIQFPCGRSGAYEVPTQTKVLTYASFKNAKHLTEVTFDDKSYYAITNIGTQPTVDGKEIISETNIFDFSDDLYGKEVEVKFLKFIRGVRKFESIEKLKQQVHSDIQKAKEIIKTRSF